MKLIRQIAFVVILLASSVTCSAHPAAAYQSRGWRPQGPPFNPSKNHQLPSPPLFERYGNPPVAYTTTTTERSYELITPKTVITTTTPAPVTPPPSPTTHVADGSFIDDIENNPALAIANSFAFNRPIYVYNGLPPYQPAYAFVPSDQLPVLPASQGFR